MRLFRFSIAVIVMGCSSSGADDGGGQSTGGAQAGTGGYSAGTGGYSAGGGPDTTPTTGAGGKTSATNTGGATGMGGAGMGGATGMGGASGSSGSGGSAASGEISVSVHPKVESVNPGGNFMFTCWVTNTTNTDCTYQIKEVGPGGGPYFSAIGGDGKPLPAGTYHVIATSVADPTKSDEATVHVGSVSVGIPTFSIVSPGAQQSFQCKVNGSTDSVCDWSVLEGAPGGTATHYAQQLQGLDVGTYVAPQTPGLYHVLAASHADPTAVSSASVYVRKLTPGGCSNPAPVGQFEEITPPPINLPGPYYEHGSTVCNFGFNTATIDPDGSIFLGTCQFGVWKSSDCGATWAHINKGSNIASDGAALDNGRQWYYLIDPTNKLIQYTGAGYNGSISGGMRSDDGGVHWKFIWPSPDGSYPTLVTGNFVTIMAMDPTDPSHLLVGFHADCNSHGTGSYKLADGVTPITDVCLGETFDKGEHWVMHNKDPRMGASEAQNPALLDSTHWLFTDHDSQSAIWWTTNSGADWNIMGTDSATHWAQQIYQAADGRWYVPGNHDLFRSTNGGASWSTTPKWSGDINIGFAGDATTMWATHYGDLNARVPAGTTVYVQSAESDGVTWTPSSFDFSHIPWAGFLEGAQTLSIDRTRHIIYATHGSQGLYRVRYK